MCRHCENLVEDKELVHQFMELTARRLAEKHPDQDITADDVDIDVRVTVTEWKPNPWAGTKAQQRVYRLLAEMDK